MALKESMTKRARAKLDFGLVHRIQLSKESDKTIKNYTKSYTELFINKIYFNMINLNYSKLLVYT